MSRNEQTMRMAVLGALAAASAVSFGVLTALERNRKLTKKDKKALRKIAKRDEKQIRVAERLHPFGKWYAYGPAALAAAAAVFGKGRGSRNERAAASAAIVLSAAISAIVNPLFDKVLPQPEMPPRRKSQPKPSFPSGHTFGLGALSLAMAYLFKREEIIGAAAAAPIALVPPLVSGTAKIVEEKHWPSEVAGGFFVALIIASLSVLAYETQRDRRSRRDLLGN